jgi:hypothetical protein
VPGAASGETPAGGGDVDRILVPVMDPELAKLLAAAIPVAGPILGALVGGLAATLGAWLVARENRKAQQEIARDADRRKRKEEQAHRLLEVANGRMAMYAQFLRDAQAGKREGLPQRVEDILATSPFDEATRMLASGPRVRAAISAFSKVDQACLVAAGSIGTAVLSGKDAAAAARRLLERIGDLQDALLVLNQATEDHIDGQDDTPEARAAERALADRLRANILADEGATARHDAH